MTLLLWFALFRFSHGATIAVVINCFGTRVSFDRIDKEIDVEDCKLFFHWMLATLTHCLKVNAFVPGRFCLMLRLDPAILTKKKRFASEKTFQFPTGIFFAFGRGFIAFHLRFRNIARGGLRTVTPASIEEYSVANRNLLAECFKLAMAQQLKNKVFHSSPLIFFIFNLPGHSRGWGEGVDSCSTERHLGHHSHSIFHRWPVGSNLCGQCAEFTYRRLPKRTRAPLLGTRQQHARLTDRVDLRESQIALPPLSQRFHVVATGCGHQSPNVWRYRRRGCNVFTGGPQTPPHRPQLLPVHAENGGRTGWRDIRKFVAHSFSVSWYENAHCCYFGREWGGGGQSRFVPASDFESFSCHASQVWTVSRCWSLWSVNKPFPNIQSPN